MTPLTELYADKVRGILEHLDRIVIEARCGHVEGMATQLRACAQDPYFDYPPSFALAFLFPFRTRR